MPYRLVVMGLATFFELAPQGRLVLMPDGRAPENTNIDPHHAGIFVHQDQVEDASRWWEPEDQPSLADQGILEFRVRRPSELRISGLEHAKKSKVAGRRTGSSTPAPESATASDEEVLDVTEFENKVPLLKDIQPSIDIRPEEADTIAQIPIRRGKLKSRLFGGNCIVGELSVNHHRGPITITAILDDHSDVKVLVLKDLPVTQERPWANQFFIANVSLRPVSLDPEASHFQIYRQLDASGSAVLRDPTLQQIQDLNAERFEAVHPFARRLLGSPTVGGTQCTVTGCCRFCY